MSENSQLSSDPRPAEYLDKKKRMVYFSHAFTQSRNYSLRKNPDKVENVLILEPLIWLWDLNAHEDTDVSIKQRVSDINVCNNVWDHMTDHINVQL